jgi:hypothetical protein
MQTKLTLPLEKSLFERATFWADEKHISLSQALTMLFQRLSNRKPEKKRTASLSEEDYRFCQQK